MSLIYNVYLERIYQFWKLDQIFKQFHQSYLLLNFNNLEKLTYKIRNIMFLLSILSLGIIFHLELDFYLIKFGFSKCRLEKDCILIFLEFGR